MFVVKFTLATNILKKPGIQKLWQADNWTLQSVDFYAIWLQEALILWKMHWLWWLARYLAMW